MTKEKLLYPFYVIKHPLDGFYEVRHREKGSVLVALFILFLFSISFSINRLYASFVVNDINPRTVNSKIELMGIFSFYFLFCIANWSITCLMEGEGRLKDILTVVGYSILPLVLVIIPNTIFSWFIASNEEAFYFIIMGAAVFWFALLLLLGIMTVHNFTLGKTLGTLVLTFVAMLIIIFLVLLLMSLVNQVILFFSSIYTEILFRV